MAKAEGRVGLKNRVLNTFVRGTLVEDGVIPKKEALKFSAGIAGQNLSYVLIANWLFYYCTDVLYLDALWVGILTAVSRIFDAFNDPIAGVYMDRHRFKSGEKLRPFLVITAPIIGVLAMMMFINPGLQTMVSKFVYILIIYLMWDLFYTFQDIAQWGMTSVMSPVSGERAQLSQWGRIGAQIGSWIPGLMPVLISLALRLGMAESTLFMIVAVLFGFGGMMISLLTAKGKERVISVKTAEPAWKSFKLLLKNKTVMLILLANILKGFAFTVPAIYFFKYNVSFTLFGIEIDGIMFSFVFGIVTGLPGTLAMLIATKIAKFLGGMKNVLVLAAFLDVATRLIAFFIGFEGYNILIVVALLGLASIPNGIVGICQTAIWGDSIDEMELKTGERAEAVTFAAQNLFGKASAGIGLLINGIVLTLLQFNGELYNADLPQSPVFYKYIWPVFILGPAMGSLLFLLPMFFVKYNEKTRIETEKALKAKRALAEAQLHSEGVPTVTEEDLALTLKKSRREDKKYNLDGSSDDFVKLLKSKGIDPTFDKPDEYVVSNPHGVGGGFLAPPGTKRSEKAKTKAAPKKNDEAGGSADEPEKE